VLTTMLCCCYAGNTVNTGATCHEHQEKHSRPLYKRLFKSGRVARSRVAFPVRELPVLYRTTAGPECCATGPLLMQMMPLNVQGVNLAGQSAVHSLRHDCQCCCC
jgi:hypothetical protein